MITVLPFDSDLFGFPVGKMPWTPEDDERKFLAETSSFQLVYIFSPNPISFTSKQIIHVDTKLTFFKGLNNPRSGEEITLLSRNPKALENFKFVDHLQFLALESGSFSRFKTDPRLQKGEFEKLYRLWIQKAISIGNVLIAPEMAGMITFDINEETAQIGLIAVDPEHRRKSWGKKLVLAAEKEAFAQGAKTMLIPTQEANIPAVRLYSELGYQLKEQTFIYHFWKS